MPSGRLGQVTFHSLLPSGQDPDNVNKDFQEKAKFESCLPEIHFNLIHVYDTTI